MFTAIRRAIVAAQPLAQRAAAAVIVEVEVAERLPVGVAQYQALTTHFLD
jgi:hypothetical protein